MRRRLKIAVWHYLPSGGGKRALYSQISGLLKNGHHVEVWCPSDADRSFLPLSNLVEEHRIALRRSRSRRWPKALWSLMQSCQIVKDLKALETHSRACAEEINRGSFDVVLAHPSKLFYMHPLARFTDKPTALYLQEVFRPLYEARPVLPWECPPHLSRNFYSPIAWMKTISNAVRLYGPSLQTGAERMAAKEYDLILVNSLFSRESIVRTYAVDAQVCYLGIDTDYFVPDQKPKENFVLGLGGLSEAKGAHLAIQALGLVPIQHRIPLVWVGNFAARQYLEDCRALAAHLEVAFEFAELIDEPKLLNLLRRARLLIYPAILEPFGYAPLEANACGTPVVAVAEGGLRETIINGVNGLLVPCRNPERLADAITQILQNVGSYDQLCRDARRCVEEKWSSTEADSRLESYLLAAADQGRAKSGARLCADVFAHTRSQT